MFLSFQFVHALLYGGSGPQPLQDFYSFDSCYSPKLLVSKATHSLRIFLPPHLNMPKLLSTQKEKKILCQSYAPPQVLPHFLPPQPGIFKELSV